MTTATFTWRAQAGQHVIKATADSSGIVAETDETNNTKTFTLTTLAADLIVQSITWTPASPSRDDKVIFSVVIKNQGSSKSQLTNVNFYIDGNSRGFQDIPAVNPGSTTTVTYNWVAQTGQHAVKAVVDEPGRAPEGDETNNEKTVTFSTLPPDLTIPAITWSPENPSKGDVVTFTVTVKNQGTGRADSSHLGYYIDAAFQSATPVGALEAGASVNVTFTWSALPDAHQIKATADYYKNLTESDENNNEKTVTFSTLTPDLIVKDITWLPVDAAVGDAVTFTATIKNQGGGRAEASKSAGYIDGHFEGYLTYPAINAGAEATATMPWQATGGSHDISVVADEQNMVLESHEDNNKLSKSVSIIPPDLSITNITWSPEHPAIGDTVTFTVTIANPGGGKAENFDVAYYVDGTFLSSGYVPVVSHSASADLIFTWVAKNGRHVFKALADYNSHIPESNENNNENSVTIIPNMPDLAIGTITWSPPEMAAGSQVTFNINIENLGGLSAPPSRLTYYVDGVVSGYADIGRMDAGSTLTQQFAWVAAAGLHSISIVADSNNQIEEIDEANNSKVVNLPPADLVVGGITWSPADASIGAKVTFSVTMKNQGNNKTEKSVANCYIDGALIASPDVPEISAGGTVTKTFEWVSRAGGHLIKVTADAGNRVTESDETNKEVSFGTLTPDLTIARADWLMENPLIDDDVTFSFVIKNQGTDASPATQMKYTIDDGRDTFKDIAAIPAGASANVTFVAKLQAGPHTVKIAIDPNNSVTELDETNNSKDLTFSTIAPDLVVKTITFAPVDAAVGRDITVTVKVENRGKAKAVNPRLSLSADNTTIGSFDIPEIDTGGIASHDFTWKVLAGAHDFTALADSNGLILESNESNNAKSRTIEFQGPTAPAKAIARPNTGAAKKGGIGDLWWLLLLVAAGLGGAAFFTALKSARKK